MSDRWAFSPLERNAYGCICAVTPWHFKAHTEEFSARSPQAHYSIMSLADIIAMPVKELAAPDAHLFLWVTGPILPVAFDVMKAWGFRYSAIAFTWVKLKRSHNPAQLRSLPVSADDLHVGLGYTTRKNAEFCLLGRRGNAKRVAKNVREIIMSPVREHSRKPEEFRDRVDAYVGPGIRTAELFARSTRAGWDCWGDQIGLFETSAA